jgi:hypothetical protein
VLWVLTCVHVHPQVNAATDVAILRPLEVCTRAHSRAHIALATPSGLPHVMRGHITFGQTHPSTTHAHATARRQWHVDLAHRRHHILRYTLICG